MLKMSAIIFAAAVFGMDFILATTDAYSFSTPRHVGQFIGAVFATFVVGWLISMVARLVR